MAHWDSDQYVLHSEGSWDAERKAWGSDHQGHSHRQLSTCPSLYWGNKDPMPEATTLAQLFWSEVWPLLALKLCRELCSSDSSKDV